jgi:hypothetical protein
MLSVTLPLPFLLLTVLGVSSNAAFRFSSRVSFVCHVELLYHLESVLVSYLNFIRPSYLPFCLVSLLIYPKDTSSSPAIIKAILEKDERIGALAFQ